MRERHNTKHQPQHVETRCAIYTRKSSEEGLEQEFNSLHAQREACEAYITSQRHEGWRVLPTLYDDGGLSGGTLERPALKRLLDDIRAKRVDLVVIYKVDRLTRSLADFAKLVDVFNASGVSFVSITQQFNTATSMGRLTLNMLLSFAQFEREVTGERIRDKIAASKRKGMWMGGHPPLGYDVRDRKLVVNEPEARQVIALFEAYVRLGSVRLLRDEFAERGVTTKRRELSDGRIIGGGPLMRGSLYGMLQNRLYIGEVEHKGRSYPAEHQAIIGLELWKAVQVVLSKGKSERDLGSRASHPSLLAGIVFDAAGDRLTPSHAKKGSKRYRYYVSRRLITNTVEAVGDGQRLPAGELEGVVTGALFELLAAPSSLLAALGGEPLNTVDQRKLLIAADDLQRRWSSLDAVRVNSIVRKTIVRVAVHADRVEIQVAPDQLRTLLLGSGKTGEPATERNVTSKPYLIVVPVALRRAGQEMRLVVEGGGASPRVDSTLAKLIHQAIQYRDQLLACNDIGVAELAAAAGVSSSHFTRVLRLGFLAPDVVEAIASGRQPIGLTATKLLRDTRLQLAWSDQRKMLGFAEAR